MARHRSKRVPGSQTGRFIAFECGVNCGFGFEFQVSRNKQLFNMSAQPVGGNYLAGVAVRK